MTKLEGFLLHFSVFRDLPRRCGFTRASRANSYDHFCHGGTALMHSENCGWNADASATALLSARRLPRFARDFGTRDNVDSRDRRGRILVKFGDVFQRPVLVEKLAGIDEGNPG